MKYVIIERNDTEGFLLVEFQNPKWDKSLVLKEKRKRTIIKNGKEVNETYTVVVDNNPHSNHIHRITLPSLIEDEDYESVTLPNLIQEVARGVQHKMDIKALGHIKGL